MCGVLCRPTDITVFLCLRVSVEVTQSGDSLQIIPNFTLKDSQDQTVLALALWQGFHDIAIQLLSGGANINSLNSDGYAMLHQAIMKGDTASALFLLKHQADSNIT